MSKLLTPGHGRIVLQICAVTAVAALMSGCSADSNRFGDAFGNPFSTGSIPHKPKKVAHASPSLGTGRTPPVTASALPPSNHVAAATPFRAPVAVSRETTGSIPSATPVRGASFGGWTGQGGASVEVGAGDSAAVLAQRYGVPENVLLQTNNLHAASEVRPGTTIVIPIYNAVSGPAGAAKVARAPVRSEPVEPVEPAAPVKTVPAHVAKAEPEEEPAPEPARKPAVPVKAVPAHVAKAEPEEEAPEPARKPAALPFKVEKPATLAERNAEAQRIVATQRAADKAAAEKVAAAQKAAEAQKVADAREAEAAAKVAAAQAAAEKAKADAAARKLASKTAPHVDAKAAAAQRAEVAKVAAAEKAAAAQKVAADREAAKTKAEAAKSAAEATKTAAAAAKAAKIAAARPAPAPAKPEQVAAVEKKVDATPTATVPPAAAAATAAPAAAPAAPSVADAGGPEFRWPAHGRIIAGFKGGAGGNDGINIAVPEGTAVKAAEGGVVAYAGNELKGYGNLVLIRHPNGYVTAYANNGEIDVKRGATVKRGDVIAKSGQSGNVSSPQLHFEVRKGSTPVDPTGMLAGT